jgi:REP element-mobilizing transposase RayT
MPNTYTQLYIHFVFAVKYREALIQNDWAERLRQYIIAIAQNHGHKVLSINNMSDHLHLFVGLNPDQSIADFMRTIKKESSTWVNNSQLTPHKFQWQEGYGAFSHSKSQIDNVVKYIVNQQDHHKKVSFLDEYKKMLINFNIDFDERYIFKLPE